MERDDVVVFYLIAVGMWIVVVLAVFVIAQNVRLSSLWTSLPVRSEQEPEFFLPPQWMLEYENHIREDYYDQFSERCVAQINANSAFYASEDVSTIHPVEGEERESMFRRTRQEFIVN